VWSSQVSESQWIQIAPNLRRSDRLPVDRAVAARTGPPPPPPIPVSDPNAPKPKEDPPKPKSLVVKKDTKKSLKGVVVKKKPRVPEKTQKKDEGSSKPQSPAPTKNSSEKGDDEKRPTKKQKVK
jgi:hypothetical protein